MHKKKCNLSELLRYAHIFKKMHTFVAKWCNQIIKLEFEALMFPHHVEVLEP